MVTSMNDIELWHGDCLELMKEIPDKSVDMILCDLPYGTTACKWDSIIPFEPLWEQYNRIIKDNGAICLFGSEPFSTKLRDSNFENYRYDWYWEKSKPSLYQHAKNRPMKSIETISVFCKSKWGHCSQLKSNRMIYYPQGIRENGIKTVTQGYNSKRLIGDREKQIGRQYMSYTGFPNDILKFPSVLGKKMLASNPKTHRIT